MCFITFCCFEFLLYIYISIYIYIYIIYLYITCLGTLAIAKVIDTSKTLRELYLSWNKIRGTSAQKLVEALGYRCSLRVLDLSWNSLHATNSKSIVLALGSSLSINTSLVHLDISNNCLDFEDCKILATSLLSNHTLIGYPIYSLHMLLT